MDRVTVRFEFTTASRIIFGPGTLQEVPPLAASMGRRALVVTGRSVERAAPLLEQLGKQGIACTTFSVPGEPTLELVSEGVEQARQVACDLVVGFGGGSALDTGKAIAALLTNEGNLLDYLEVIGRSQPLTQPSAPLIAIPTTAGTGAEVTRNAVLGSPEHRLKVSMRSPLMLPRLAVVDPVLTYSMPPPVTASTGLDALTQLLEAYVSNKATPLTDAVSLAGLWRGAGALRRAYENGNDTAARQDMSLASLFGGIALANAGLGVVHGLAGVIGGMFSAPHGAVCARLLPFVMEANVRALQVRAPESLALSRYAGLARILAGPSGRQAEDGIRWVRDLCAALQIPSLAEYGLDEKDFPAVVAKAQKASSTKGNPIGLTDEEIGQILERATQET